MTKDTTNEPRLTERPVTETPTFERPNADRHIDFEPFNGQLVTVRYHSNRAPGNCGIAGGTLQIANDGAVAVTAAGSGTIILPVERVIGVDPRPVDWPQTIGG
jgi:hypothetical protein